MANSNSFTPLPRFLLRAEDSRAQVESRDRQGPEYQRVEEQMAKNLSWGCGKRWDLAWADSKSPVHGPLSHLMQLTKHNFKDKIIFFKFKKPTSDHLWTRSPLQLHLSHAYETGSCGRNVEGRCKEWVGLKNGYSCEAIVIVWESWPWYSYSTLLT